jgi:cellulase/cellobiase CelA1
MVTLVFPNGQVITQLWGGRYTQTGSTVVIRNETWNAVIPPNGTTVAGFLASWNGTTGTPTITCSRTP